MDFDLRELPLTREVYHQEQKWMQIMGDPAIQGSLFMQQRIDRAMDKRIDEILALVVELVKVHGVFHAKMHFSSSRATQWLLDDLFRYRILDIEDLTDLASAWSGNSTTTLPMRRSRTNASRMFSRPFATCASWMKPLIYTPVTEHL